MLGAIRLGEDTYWVGSTLEGDTFQCHTYLIVNGHDSVLIDPGSVKTIDDTLAKVASIIDLDDIKYLVCHHSDPDITSALPKLSEKLTREDVVVVSEWRAAELLDHYDHRFEYYLADKHEWALDLGNGKRLEFQLTPYLHFPGAFVTYDPATKILFSSDLFGGFVPDESILIGTDLDYIINAAKPFHQHYMPSKALLSAGLARIQRRWPDIAMIAPQHGHVISTELVAGAFKALRSIDCGVFTLADADLDLNRLLRIFEAQAQITSTMLTDADPASLVNSLARAFTSMGMPSEVELYIDMPGEGWAKWKAGVAHPVAAKAPADTRAKVCLEGQPEACLMLPTTIEETDVDLLAMLEGLSYAVRPAVDQFLERQQQEEQRKALEEAAMVDALTGLGNRHGLEAHKPEGTYCLIMLDLDHFKKVNDAFGHGVGDEVLREAARSVVKAVREGDRVWRYGGEEILVYLPGASLEVAETVAERIRKDIENLNLGEVGRITASLGVAGTKARFAESFESVQERSDKALYAAKNSGRNQVRVG